MAKATRIKAPKGTVSRAALLCVMERRHVMDDEPEPAHKGQGDWGIRVDWTCVRCGTKREDIYNRFSMEVGERRYHHSPEYRAALDGFDERPTAADIRKLLFASSRRESKGEVA